MRRGSALTLLFAFTMAAGVSGCSEAQSVMAPASDLAERTWTLGLTMIAGGAVIFAGVMALTYLAIYGPEVHKWRLAAVPTVFAGGVVFPGIVLTLLLVYGLVLMRPTAGTAGDRPDIKVEGEQWWWRVTYMSQGQRPLEGANEVRVPVGRPVTIALESRDVIHSFWVPRLAGKVDMIPGKTNTLRITAREAGVYRGQCAEYCGGPHAFMALRVIALEAGDYDRWLTEARTPQPEPKAEIEQRGHKLFLSRGCSACHAVSGTMATGQLGPDLTNIGARGAIAAETLPMSRENLILWISANEQVKPNNLMPPYRNLPRDEVEAIASYLVSLK